MSRRRLEVIRCDHWSAGICSRPESVAKWGTRPSVELCTSPIACGCGVLTGEVMFVESESATLSPARREVYARLWSTLFGFAADPLGDERAEFARLREFASRVPCGECRRHYLAWLGTTPPYVVDREAYFRALVVFKNSINVRLGKPTLSIEDAFTALT